MLQDIDITDIKAESKTNKLEIESNFKHKFILKDLYEEDTEGVLKTYDFDMIIGGPPCQDFSIAGKRNEKGKMANLTQRFAEIVINSGVEWFVMENV